MSTAERQRTSGSCTTPRTCGSRSSPTEYLADAGLGIAEIAFLLHFADSTAFDRAFKRWTGEPPARHGRRLF